MLKTVLKHKVQTYVGKSLEILLAEGRLYKLIDTLQIKQCFPDDMLDLLPQIDEDIKTLNDDLEHEEQAAKISISRKFLVYDDDDDEYSIQTQEYLKKFSSAITPDLPITDSLIMEDEHLDTIPVTESANTIKSSVEDLVPTPSEFVDLSDGESECDVPINDDSPESHFMTFSNPLFDSNDDFSSDDESLSEEEIQKDEFKYFSNPLYDLDDEIITNEKILPNQKDLDIVIPIPPGIDERCFNAESDLLESLLNRDSPIDSTKIDFIFDEFSLPRPPEIPSSQSFSQIPMEEIDLFLDNSIPSGIDDDDSEGDILTFEELLDNVLSSLPESDDFTVDVEPVAAMTNDFDVLNNDEPFDPGEDYPDFEDSRAHGFVHLFELHILSFI
ncbi:hypothetical protein Tco_0967730 [Tanacetum coccineum]